MMKKSKTKVLVSLVVILVVVFALCAAYLNDYYPAAPQAESLAVSDSVSVETLKNGAMVYSPDQPRSGLIFYPGGKVEYTAYSPLMAACAERGILCVLVEMPFHLAVLDINAADGIAEQYPEIENWYIGGHSLGGSMAASYLEDHVDDFEGLVLLAAYSTADLSASPLGVLSVYGSEDQVLNSEKYEEYKANLPNDFSEMVIAGGNHAGFGMYGEQEGDGDASISNEEQIALTAQAISSFIN